MKVSAPLMKVRGQPLSDGAFVCVLVFFGFGESGSDCCASLALQSRESIKIRAQMTDDAASVAGLRICMIRPPTHVHRALCVRILRRTRRAPKFQTFALRSHCFRPLLN